MTRIVETTRIAEGPDALWKDIGPFRAVGEWHPLLSRVEGEGEHPGALRAAEGKDGSRQIERLIETAPEQPDQSAAANAVADAIGKRIRDLPLSRERIKQASI